MKDENGNRRAIEEKVVVYWSKKFQLRAERENKKFLDFLKKLQEHLGNLHSHRKNGAITAPFWFL